MLDTIEKEIIKALEDNNDFKKFTTESFPADFEEYVFTSAKGCLLVRYDGSSYSKPQTLYVVTQDETYEFSVLLALRHLKKYNDAYPYLKKIKETLTGLSIGGKKLYPLKKVFITRKKGDHWWGFVFAITLPTQENINDEEEEKVIALWSENR